MSPPSAAVQAHKASLLADQRIQPAVLVSITVVTTLAPGQVVQCPCCLPIQLPSGAQPFCGCVVSRTHLIHICSAGNAARLRQSVWEVEYRVQHSWRHANDSRWVCCRWQVNCQRVTHWLTARLSTWWAHPARRVPSGSDEGEEEEEDGDGMLQDERVSPSAAVGAIDTLMRYFEQCQLTTPDDIKHLSAIKRRVDYTLGHYFKSWHDQLTKTKTAVNLL